MTPTPPASFDNPHPSMEGFKPQPGSTKSAHPKNQPFSKVKNTLPITKPPTKPTQQKNLPRRSSKPIINWFQRKLAGTARAKRVENLNSVAENVVGKGRAGSTPMRLQARVTSSPIPSPTSHGGRPQGRLDAQATRRKTMSLSDGDTGDFSVDDGEDTSLDQSSFARESNWSPASALEADDDASVRPIPPSVPPSPSPSRSSSSYLSDPRTFRSIAPSTKPTTLMSIDLNGNGMAHIAQAPMTSPIHINRFPPHIRTSSSTNGPSHFGSGGSITFSQLPQSSSRPSSLSNPGGVTSQLTIPQGAAPVASVQAPLHTTHHPRNNPRPSSPPPDNASVLTLASSAYAMPGLRINVAPSATPSARGVGDSLSHFGGSIIYADAESTSQLILGDDDRLEERDVDASVRALRPRSSRRGSWESEASGWSARVQPGTGTPSLARERSLWTTNSVRTGGFSTENAETYDRSDNRDEDSKADLSPKGSVSDSSPVEVGHLNLPNNAGTEQSLNNSSNEESTSDCIRVLKRKNSADTVAHPSPKQDVPKLPEEKPSEAPISSDVKICIWPNHNESSGEDADGGSIVSNTRPKETSKDQT